ncbi:hypothetical protein [Dokdonella ginsengisoli]|uniref:Uncharacterized protein n=1 Tax=Dokdonella ginsengisoli TaxID=363846 RepID=A0ABV9QXY6_9GAMM
MLQLNPPLPMLTPRGEGFAHILIDYGPESDLYWTVFITDTGEVWTFSNREVRAAKNITLGRTRVGAIPSATANEPRDGRDQCNRAANGSAALAEQAARQEVS